jgi:uncharacterized membrane protein YgdD (TMEM256/DUF423 family)
MNKTLVVGSLLGFLSVAIGAYVEHFIKPLLSSQQFAMLMKAISYHQLYSVVIIGIALSLFAPISWQIKKWLIIAAWFFIIGTICFSFSIYLSVFADTKSYLRITPFGGITLMLAWLVLLWVGLQSHVQAHQ